MKKIKNGTPRPGATLSTKAGAFQVALFYPDFGRVSSGQESHGNCTKSRGAHLIRAKRAICADFTLTFCKKRV
jgi:hypothetical protein